MKFSFLHSMSWTFQYRNGYISFKEIYLDMVISHTSEDFDIKYRKFAELEIQIHHYWKW